jgi:hypothetical protein
VPDQQDKQESANLERLNEELTSSLDRCRFLVSECRTKLVADLDGLLIPGKDAPLTGE